MPDDYTQQSWFTHLQNDAILLLLELREAQLAQGDMKEL